MIWFYTATLFLVVLGLVPKWEGGGGGGGGGGGESSRWGDKWPTLLLGSWISKKDHRSVVQQRFCLSRLRPC